MQGAEFFAWHGFYPEEQKLGSCFVVDIEVEFTPGGNLNEDELNNTVNYEQLYNIVCEEMKRTKKLIETVAQAIIDETKREYAFVEKIQVNIKKLNPPLGGKVSCSNVIMSYVK